MPYVINIAIFRISLKTKMEIKYFKSCVAVTVLGLPEVL